MHHPTDRVTHTTAFATPVVEHWLEWEIAQWVHSTKDRSVTYHTMSECSYHRATSCSCTHTKGRCTVFSFLNQQWPPSNKKNHRSENRCKQMLHWRSVEHIHRCEMNEMFYLMTHKTHFIYGYMASDMVKDHSDSEKGNPLLPHRQLFPINSKGSLYASSHRQGSTYHSLCYNQSWSTGWNEK